MTAQAIALLFALVALAPGVALALHLDLARASSTYTPRHRLETGNPPGRRPELRGSDRRISW